MEGNTLGDHYLTIIRALFRSQKDLADKAIAQISPDQYSLTPDSESNSIAVMMKHLAGNMISRWTDFLTTDGEKPDRKRDTEFTGDFTSADDLHAYWECGWNCLFSTLESLSADDLMRTVLIRGEAHTVVEAIERQVAHYGYHVGQIVYLARHIRSEQWQTLSIPRGKSQEFLEARLTQATGTL